MKSLLLSIAIICSINLYAQTNPCNCCTEKHAEFDFWKGDWNVTNPDGSAAGTNSIVKIHSPIFINGFVKNRSVFYP